MPATVFYGCILQAWGPLAVAILGSLAFELALAVIAMAASFAALLPIQFTSFVYLAVVRANGVMKPETFAGPSAAAADAGRGWIVALGVLFHEITRVLVAVAAVKAEWYFRRHHQVLFSSRFRLLPVGAAAGVGLATTQSLLTFGALLDARARLGEMAPDAFEFVNFDACPQLPHAYFHALSWCFQTVCIVTWTALVVPCVAGLLGTPASAALPKLSSPIPARRQFIIPRPTTLTAREAAVGLAVVAAFHFVFSLVTLLNAGAFDWATVSAKAGRGCVVSLPVQGGVMILSLLLAAGVARAEVVRRIDPNDV